MALKDILKMNPDFDGDNDLDEVLQFLIDEGFVPREPTSEEMVSLEHPPGTVITLVLEREGTKMHLIRETDD